MTVATAAVDAPFTARGARTPASDAFRGVQLLSTDCVPHSRPQNPGRPFPRRESEVSGAAKVASRMCKWGPGAELPGGTLPVPPCPPPTGSPGRAGTRPAAPSILGSPEQGSSTAGPQQGGGRGWGREQSGSGVPALHPRAARGTGTPCPGDDGTRPLLCLIPLGLSVCHSGVALLKGWAGAPARPLPEGGLQLPPPLCPSASDPRAVTAPLCTSASSSGK